jgi:hypothetical protein
MLRMSPALVGLLLVAGCATSSAPTPRAASAPREGAPADVAVVTLAASGTTPATWVFISKGLAALGHPELVLSVKREPGEGSDAYPSDAPDIVSSLAKAVREGRRLQAWHIASSPEGMLGRADLTGLLVLPQSADPRLGLAGPSLALLVVTKDELAAAIHFGVPRVANLLGMRERFFPFPPWTDRRRTSVVSLPEMESSLIGGIGARMFVRGASSWRDLQHDEAPIVLRLTPPAGRDIAEMLREVGDETVALFTMAPPDDIEGRFVWTKLGAPPSVIMPGNTAPPRAAGNFVVLLSSTEDAGAVSTEDGFAVFVPKSRWTELLAALVAGRPFSVRGAADKSSFALNWTTGAPESADGAPDDVVDVPPDLRYKAVSGAVNGAARRKLTAAFGAADAASLGALVSSFVAVGPGLWRSLEAMPDATSAGIPSTFMVPLGPDPKNAQRLEGRSYLDAENAAGLARLLASALPKGAKPKVRRPSRLELEILWRLVPFDLEEPIFVVEVGPRSLLAILDPKTLKLTWIDDLSGATLRRGTGIVWGP